MKLRNLALSLTILASAGLVLASYAQKSGAGHSPEKFKKGERGEDNGQIIRARQNWFYRQRAYPLPRIPAFARERAWNAMRQMRQSQQIFLQQKYGTDYKRLAAAAALAASVVNTGANWTPIGPQPTNEYFFQPSVSGRVTALVVDPCDSTGNTVFLGGAQGGLWLTTNGGTNWSPLTDDAPSLGVGSLAVPPSTPGSAGCVGTVSKTVYVGTGEQNFSLDSFYGAGVLICTTSNGSSYSCTPDQTFGAFNSQSNPLSFDSGGPYIGSLAVDPQNPSIMLAAVSGFESTLPSGVYCSANSGSTWTHVLPPLGIDNVDGTAVAFDQAGVAYAALGMLDGGRQEQQTTLNGVWQTQSSGAAALLTNCSSASFVQLGALANVAGSPSAMGRIAISVYSSSTTSSSSDQIFAAVANASDDSSSLLGIFKSTNGGSSWSQPSTAALVTQSGGFCDAQCFYDLTIAIDPHNSSVIYAGGADGRSATGAATLIASTDGGSTWNNVSDNLFSLCTSANPSGCLSGLHVDTHAIAFKPDGSLLYVGTDGGAWKTSGPESPTATQSWTNLNQTLALTQIYPGMSNNPAGWQYRSFLGAQDNGVQVLGSDISNPSGGALPWSDTLSCGDGGVTLVDPLMPSSTYAECAYIPGVIGGVFKSLFNGTADDSNANVNSTFLESDSGIDFTQPGNFIPPMAIGGNPFPGTPPASALYFGTNHVWGSLNGGNSWVEVSTDVTGAAGPNNSLQSFCSANPGYCVLTALAVSPSDPNEVVTGSDVGQIFLTQNISQPFNTGYSTWGDIASTSAALPQTAVTSVAVDPNNANLIYATYSGFSGTYSTSSGSITIPPGHVFLGLFTPGGTPVVVWTNVSSDPTCSTSGTTPGPLPNIPVNAVIVDPDHAGQLFVGTDVGVFMGTLQGAAPAYTGACWQPLGSSLPNSEVLSLSLNDASRTLFAGTHGRSAWAYALGDAPAFSLGGLSPASADAGASSALTLALDGQGFTASSTVNWTPQGGTTTSLSQTSPPSGCATPTCIAVQVPTAQLASGAVVQVSVSDSGNTTNSLPFTVTSATPTITQISPITGTTGSSPVLTLTGTGFASKSTVALSTELAISPCTPVAVSSGATSTQIAATIPGSCLQYGGIFFVTAINPTPGGGSSNPSLLAAASPYGTACVGMNPPGCLLTITGPAPANDSFSSATSISSGTFSATEDTSGATTASSDPALPSTCTSGAANGGDAKSVWFKYTPTTAVTAEADTIGSSYDTILSVWDPPSSSAAVPPARPFVQPPVALILAFTLAAFLLGFAFRRHQPFSRRFATALALALLAGSLGFAGACGGGGGGVSPTPPPVSGLTNVACNDDITSGVTRTSQVSGLPLSANTTYYFMVTTWGLPLYDGSGNFTGTLADGGKLVFNFSAK